MPSQALGRVQPAGQGRGLGRGSLRPPVSGELEGKLLGVVRVQGLASLGVHPRRGPEEGGRGQNEGGGAMTLAVQGAQEAWRSSA